MSRLTFVRSFHALGAIALLVPALLVPRSSRAVTDCYWRGNSPLGPEWSRFDNWYLLGRPGSQDWAYFQDTDGYHSVNIDQAWTISTMYIWSSQTYLFSGARLTFQDGQLVMEGSLGSSANHGFLCPLGFQGTSCAIVNIGGAQLTLTGDVSLNLSGAMGIRSEFLGSVVQIRGHITGAANSLELNYGGDQLVELANSNSYQADTHLWGGTVRATADQVIGTGTLTIDQGLLDLNGHNETVGPGAVTQPGIVFGSPGGTINLGGADNTLTVSTLGTWIKQTNGGTSYLDQGNLALATSSATREVNVQLETGGLTITSVISGGGTPGAIPSIAKTGPGHLVFGGANTFTRPLRIDDGTLGITDPAALGAAGEGNETILNGGDLLLSINPPGDAIGESLIFAGRSQLSALSSCEWSGPIAIADSSAEFSVDPAVVLTVSGVVSGDPALGIRKVGEGELILTGANTYSGGTTVVAGMIQADASSGSPTGSGPVRVMGGGVLDAWGSLAGPVSLDSLATLAVGGEASTATLSIPALSASGEDTVSLKVDGSGGSGTSDQIQVSGSATLAGMLRVTALSEPAAGDSFTVMTYADHTGEFDTAELPALADSSLSWEVNYGPGALTLRVLGSSSGVSRTSGVSAVSITRLEAPAPNPMREDATLRFDLARPGRVELTVYDVRGRRVADILTGAEYAAGTHTVNWKAHDERGRPLASGTYLAQLSVDGAPVGPARRLFVLR